MGFQGLAVAVSLALVCVEAGAVKVTLSHYKTHTLEKTTCRKNADGSVGILLDSDHAKEKVKVRIDLSNKIQFQYIDDENRAWAPDPSRFEKSKCHYSLYNVEYSGNTITSFYFFATCCMLYTKADDVRSFWDLDISHKDPIHCRFPGR